MIIHFRQESAYRKDKRRLISYVSNDYSQRREKLQYWFCVKILLGTTLSLDATIYCDEKKTSLFYFPVLFPRSDFHVS